MKRLSPPSSTFESPGGGFSLLPLPPAPPHSHSKLRRCSSLPIGAPSAQSIVNGSRNHWPSPHASSPLRVAPDPNPVLSYGSPKPNHMPKAGASSPASGSESHASKRLKRMSERMKEMKQWVDQLVEQTDQDSDSKTGNGEAENMDGKKSTESNCECSEEDKILSLDRQGEAMNIRFKCPCGDSYHILLLGQDYYYKLL